MCSLILVGLMGSGKTTIGKALAKRLDMPFFDSDHEIERRCGVRIPTIFEIEGEAGFRRREAETVAELLSGAPLVLATGGGAVLDGGTRALMGRSGWVVYLDVPTRLLVERTRHDTNRPLLQVADPAAKLEALRAQRDGLYREVADFVLDGARYHSGSAAQQILHAWQAHLESSTSGSGSEATPS